MELKDKDGNLLRTTYLDYNTKDSVGIFRTGGSMKDKDGNIIESVSGEYDAKAGAFQFPRQREHVYGFGFHKDKLAGLSCRHRQGEFGGLVYAWKDENMLTSREGWYDRPADLFFFTKNVHILTENQEGWCDTLYFSRFEQYGRNVRECADYR